MEVAPWSFESGALKFQVQGLADVSVEVLNDG